MTGRIKIDIEEVHQLEGCSRVDTGSRADVFAHVGVFPKGTEGVEEGAKYAFVSAPLPQHGIFSLGRIDLKTRVFHYIDPRTPTVYSRPDRVVSEVFVPVKQIREVQRFDEIIGAPGISIRKTLTAEDPYVA